MFERVTDINDLVRQFRSMLSVSSPDAHLLSQNGLIHRMRASLRMGSSVTYSTEQISDALEHLSPLVESLVTRGLTSPVEATNIAALFPSVFRKNINSFIPLLKETNRAQAFILVNNRKVVEALIDWISLERDAPSIMSDSLVFIFALSLAKYRVRQESELLGRLATARHASTQWPLVRLALAHRIDGISYRSKYDAEERFNGRTAVLLAGQMVRGSRWQHILQALPDLVEVSDAHFFVSTWSRPGLPRFMSSSPRNFAHPETIPFVNSLSMEALERLDKEFVSSQPDIDVRGEAEAALARVAHNLHLNVPDRETSPYKSLKGSDEGLYHSRFWVRNYEPEGLRYNFDYIVQVRPSVEFFGSSPITLDTLRQSRDTIRVDRTGGWALNLDGFLSGDQVAYGTSNAMSGLLSLHPVTSLASRLSREVLRRSGLNVNELYAIEIWLQGYQAGPIPLKVKAIAKEGYLTPEEANSLLEV